VPALGLTQSNPPFRCYAPLGRCAASCKTVADCPVIYRECMQEPSCKKVSATDEWGFCGSWDEP
jgi:hypothetical protein